jgi:hypothetical protein
MESSEADEQRTPEVEGEGDEAEMIRWPIEDEEL